MTEHDYDFIIIGSGFGGAVSALRLAEKGYRVAVMEAGRRWRAEDFPRSNWSVRRYFWQPSLGLYGFFSLRFFKHIITLQGHGVGGGSITYCQTLWQPSEKVWEQVQWASLAPWKSVMPQHYKTAKKMLGASQNRQLAQADDLLKTMANAAGVGDKYYETEVGVFFGDGSKPEGSAYPDPYFGGKGPERRSCVGCGGCMVGCRYDAKNTLDKNYLYLAEALGVKIFDETEVTHVIPLSPDGAGGYRIETKSTIGWQKNRRSFTARGVVFSAGSLGTQSLMFKMKDKGLLPLLSDCLGRGVRTNAESLIGVRYLDNKRQEIDCSKGVAIGSGVFIDDYTHIEATRYPEGSDVLGSLITFLVNGRAGWPRAFRWFAVLLKNFLRHPIKTMRMTLPFDFAKQSIIFLCMQTLDGSLTMRYKRPWYWPFKKKLMTFGDKIPTYIPAANAFAELGAKVTGGKAAMSITEILLNIPMTAHCIGGVVMGETPQEGVCNGRLEVFGYKNMYVCDGSVISANLGVNPSLTITALTEYAMSMVPSKTSS